MKKPLTIPDEPQPRNITRADLVITEGFGLEVDGRMKTVFPTLEVGAEKGEGSQSRVSDAPSQGIRRCGKEVAGIVADRVTQQLFQKLAATRS